MLPNETLPDESDENLHIVQGCNQYGETGEDWPDSRGYNQFGYQHGYNRGGYTPLMVAAIVGDYNEVKRLLELGANPNAVDRDWGSSKAVNFAGRKAKSSEVHRRIERLLIEFNPYPDEISDTFEEWMAKEEVERRAIKELVAKEDAEIEKIRSEY